MTGDTAPRAIALHTSSRARAWLEHPLVSLMLARLADESICKDLDNTAIDQLVQAEAPSERLMLQTIGSLLLDLQRWGGTLEKTSKGLLLSPAASTNQDRFDLRRKLLHERQQQLLQPAAQSFLRSMESMQLYRGKFFSIFSLMRAGKQLAEQLKLVASGQLAPESVIQPFIQVIKGEERCEETGMLLRDIWRYFRHTWSLPYHATPGRGLMVLIRDRATAPSAVIGIAMLSSAPAQLADRDGWIGWGAQPLLRELSCCQEPHAAQALADWLEGRLQTGLNELYVQDFLEEGQLTPADLCAPTVSTVHKLRAAAARMRECHRRVADSGLKNTALKVSQRSSAARQHAWGDTPPDETPVFGVRGYTWGGSDEPEEVSPYADDWRRLTRQPLYRWRRAELLAELLRVKCCFRALAPQGLKGPQLPELLKNEEGRHSVTFLARRMKAERMGTMLADVSVCGAIAPYQPLLGGKLVALLTLSSEVRAAYRQRYQHSPSVIASALAGRPIVRPAELVLLTTTALYGKHSSQYNRLRLPCTLPGASGGAGPGYISVGSSDGFGTLQFSQESIERLSRLVSQSGGGLKLTSLPGEGTSPRLRKVRAGLDLLGIESEQLLRHGVQRGILAAPLARNVGAVLQGLAEVPDYYASEDAGLQHTRALVQYWYERWLLPRLARPTVLAQVSAHTLTWPVQHGARVSLPDEDTLDEQQDRRPRTDSSSAA